MRARDFSHDIYQPVPIREISAEDRAEVRRWELRLALEERAKREKAARRRAVVIELGLLVLSGLWLALKAVLVLALAAAVIVEAGRGIAVITGHAALFGAVWLVWAVLVGLPIMGVRWWWLRRRSGAVE